MRILFFGDIVGRIGRKAIVRALPELKKKLKPDLILANAENLAHGKGVTIDTLKEMTRAGIGYFTSGNHFWSKREEVEKVVSQKLPVIRPANYPDSALGQAHMVITVHRNKVLLINLVGRVFVKDEEKKISCPFQKIDEILAKFPDVKIKIIDFHAEATSEKVTFGHYLSGRVSALLGTHTHIQTADEQILAGGTAYITDLGMVGAKDSVIGVEKQNIINHFIDGRLYEPIAMEIPKKGEAIINGVLVEINEKTGRAKKIKRIKKEVAIY